jgi:general secretion pathway protein H
MVRRMVKHPPSATGSADGGYTLIELLVVLSVIGLLLLAVPVIVSAGFPGVQAKTAAQLLADDLRAARNAAIMNGIEARIDIDRSGRRYRIVPRGTVRDLPHGVVLALAYARDGGSVRFYPDGSSTGGTMRIGSDGHQHIVIGSPLTGRIALDE